MISISISISSYLAISLYIYIYAINKHTHTTGHAYGVNIKNLFHISETFYPSPFHKKPDNNEDSVIIKF